MRCCLWGLPLLFLRIRLLLFHHFFDWSLVAFWIYRYYLLFGCSWILFLSQDSRSFRQSLLPRHRLARRYQKIYLALKLLLNKSLARISFILFQKIVHDVWHVIDQILQRFPWFIVFTEIFPVHENMALLGLGVFDGMRTKPFYLPQIINFKLFRRNFLTSHLIFLELN